MLERINVRGVKFDNVSADEAMEKIEAFLLDKREIFDNSDKTFDELKGMFDLSHAQEFTSFMKAFNEGIDDLYNMTSSNLFPEIKKILDEYVIGQENGNVKLLSMYNLYVGGKYESGTWTSYGSEATGIQDSTMLGYVSGQTIRKGTTMFSNTNYWSSTVSSYPAYVYDSNSTLYNYVENYKTYLESQGAEIEEARLIKYK